MGEDNYTFEDLAGIRPELWREKAKEPGVLQRVREIKTPEDLLKLRAYPGIRHGWTGIRFR
jgi:hypothetical protein